MPEEDGPPLVQTFRKARLLTEVAEGDLALFGPRERPVRLGQTGIRRAPGIAGALFGLGRRQMAVAQRLMVPPLVIGLTIVGFPSNDFRQELTGDGEIAKFCTLNYGVSFPMAARSRVTGPHANPLFAAIASRPAPTGEEPSWNFTKYLLDRSGRIKEGNRVLGRMLGRTPAELAGTTFAELSHPDDVDADATRVHAREIGRALAVGDELAHALEPERIAPREEIDAHAGRGCAERVADDHAHRALLG